MCAEVLSNCAIVVVRQLALNSWVTWTFVGEQVLDVQDVDVADLLHWVGVLRLKTGLRVLVRTANNAQWVKVAFLSVKAKPNLKIVEIVFFRPLNTITCILQPGVLENEWNRQSLFRLDNQ
jgi:hypothetical protein